MKKIVLFTILIISVSCSPDVSKLERSLRFAGKNRSELEKVLEHYSNDLLKYQAACFLIENMPYYYSYKDGRSDQYIHNIYRLAEENNGSGDEALKILEREYGIINPDEFEIIYDSHQITADFLINNIDWAFKVWEEKPWNKNLSFEDFCETILPYRIDTEPLEYWREYYYTTYQPVLDSLLLDLNNPKEAIDVLWETIHEKQWLFIWEKPYGYLYPGAITLDTLHRIGDCVEYNNFAIYLMRSLGIPGGTDAYLQYPYGDGIHLWNYVPDSDGRLWDFSINGYPPKPSFDREKLILGSVFRTCFGVQQNSLPIITNGREDLPPLLNTVFKKDVSDLYLDDASIVVSIDKPELKDSLLYLCTFSRNGWAPIRWTVWKDGSFIFPTVEKKMLYLSAYYKNKELIPINVGCVDERGEYIAYVADTTNLQTMIVGRKYPYSKTWFSYRKRIVGGKFQASNDPKFQNAVTLHTINKEPLNMRWGNIEFNTSSKYRYVRYLSGPERGHCNMAEMVFLDENEKTLHGKIIGTDGSYQDKDNNKKEAVFDKDPLTFFDAIEAKGSWVGLDLGESKRIRAVNYLFRNDDNNIRIRDLYELFYFGEEGWVSLGKKMANSDILEFENAPTNALFWLKNHTRGKEELPFLYENGEQVFWVI